jgi:EF-P beta-lysylation protein EpmB
MITPIETAWEPEPWRNELRTAIRSSLELLEYLGLDHPDAAAVHGLADIEADFPVLVPRSYASRMTRHDPCDPLLRQVLAHREESREVAGFTHDALGETLNSRVAAPGLIKKYHARALLITTSGCAVHCRYCFRRHFPYQEHRPNAHDEALEAVRADPSIAELILSGGDPLLLDDEHLNTLLQRIGAIAHVRRVRIHTRIPVVLPQRVTAGLVQALHDCPVPIVMVIHANHANELNQATELALSSLAKTVRFLYNQAVLLRVVNDSLEAQIDLCESLFRQHVQPYYLHLPDRVAGTHHFFVDDTQAATVHQGMQASLPGYLVPKLVREIPGEAAKTPLAY